MLESIIAMLFKPRAFWNVEQNVLIQRSVFEKKITLIANSTHLNKSEEQTIPAYISTQCFIFTNITFLKQYHFAITMQLHSYMTDTQKIHLMVHRCPGIHENITSRSCLINWTPSLSFTVCRLWYIGLQQDNKCEIESFSASLIFLIKELRDYQFFFAEVIIHLKGLSVPENKYKGRCYIHEYAVFDRIDFLP